MLQLCLRHDIYNNFENRIQIILYPPRHPSEKFWVLTLFGSEYVYSTLYSSVYWLIQSFEGRRAIGTFCS
jgi:hypothetical protein